MTSPWVSVNADGTATTLTSEPPASLTSTGPHVFITNGATATSTVAPPVATVSGDSKAGSFIACTPANRSKGPFCQPVPGTAMRPGAKYYVTWDPTYEFTNSTIRVQASLGGNSQGISSDPLPVTQGYWIWDVSSTILQDKEATGGALDVDLSISTDVGDTNGDGAPEQQPGIEGPRVAIAQLGEIDDDGLGHADSGAPSIAAIVVPAVIAVILVVALAFGFWRWRRTGAIFGTGSRSAGGYGSRQSKGQRLAGGGAMRDTNDIQLGRAADTGGNVFRQEISRQDRNV